MFFPCSLKNLNCFEVRELLQIFTQGKSLVICVIALWLLSSEVVVAFGENIAQVSVFLWP